VLVFDNLISLVIECIFFENRHNSSQILIRAILITKIEWIFIRKRKWLYLCGTKNCDVWL